MKTQPTNYNIGPTNVNRDNIKDIYQSNYKTIQKHEMCIKKTPFQSWWKVNV